MKAPQVQVTATLLVVAASCLAAPLLASELPAAAAGCPSSANATNAHDQIIKLSQLLDPSGRLTKMIAEFHPHPAHGHHAAIETGSSVTEEPLQVAASELEPVKRETEVAANAEAAPTTTTSQPSSSSATPEVTEASTSAGSTQAPATTTAPAVESNVTKGPQVVSTTAESKNVTVNVFLQLAPDAKTEELVSTWKPLGSIAQSLQPPSK